MYGNVTIFKCFDSRLTTLSLKFARVIEFLHEEIQNFIWFLLRFALVVIVVVVVGQQSYRKTENGKLIFFNTQNRP